MLIRVASFVWALVVLSSVAVAQSAAAPSTVSAEARSIIESTLPQPIPGELTSEVAEIIRNSRQGDRDAANERLKEALLSSVEELTLHGVPVLLLTPKNLNAEQSAKAAIYIHGGGYVLGTAFDSMAAQMADEMGIKIYSIEYRLAPEDPYPAGLDDCVAAYREILKRHAADDLVMFGVSAGGGMTLATILRARDEGLPMPAAAGLVTPWCELSHTGDAYLFNDGRDPILTWNGQLDKMAAAYAGKTDAKDPLVSPVYGDYSKGFPPSFISTGTRDLLMSDCVRLHQNMRQAGVQVDLAVWEGLWHAFQMFPIPEGELARKDLAAFLTGKLKMSETE